MSAGERVVELLFADGHLGFVFGAEEDFEFRFADDGVDRLEQRRVVGGFHELVARVDFFVLGGVANQPVGRAAELRDAAEKLAGLEAVGGEKGIGGGVVAEIAGEGAVGGEVEEGALELLAAGEGERAFVAEEDETRAVKNGPFLGGGRIGAVRDAVDAVGFADVFCEGGDVFRGDERRAGAVEEEISPREGVGERGVGGGAVGPNGALDDFQVGETAVLHRDHFRGEIAGGPEAHLGGRQLFFDEGEDARRVGDVADVHDLPRGAEQNARGTPGRRGGAEGGDEGGGGGRCEKGAAVHGNSEIGE